MLRGFGRRAVFRGCGESRNRESFALVVAHGKDRGGSGADVEEFAAFGAKVFRSGAGDGLQSASDGGGRCLRCLGGCQFVLKFGDGLLKLIARLEGVLGEGPLGFAGGVLLERGEQCLIFRRVC